MPEIEKYLDTEEESIPNENIKDVSLAIRSRI